VWLALCLLGRLAASERATRVDSLALQPAPPLGWRSWDPLERSLAPSLAASRERSLALQCTLRRCGASTRASSTALIELHGGELGLPLDEPLTKQRIDARWRRIARYVHSDKLDKDRRNDLFTRLTRHKEALIKSCCEPETAPQAEQHQQQQLLLDSTAEESASQDE